MERGDGVTQLAGTVAVEIFTAQKGHSEFYFSWSLYKHRVAGTPTTHGHTKPATASGENNLIHTSAIWFSEAFAIYDKILEIKSI